MAREVTAQKVEKLVEPYIQKNGNVRFLPEEKIDVVVDEISDNFENVFTDINDYGNGIRKLAVGKLGKARMVLKYEILIR